MWDRRPVTDSEDMRAALVSELEARLASGAPGLVVLVDADDLREHNRLHGLASGDATLAAIGARLEDRQAGRVHRYVGDTYAFVVTGEPEAVARAVARRLIPLAAGDPHPCSFGAASLHADGPDAGALMTAAERRLGEQQARGPRAEDRVLDVLDTLVVATWPAARERAARAAALATVVAGRLGLQPRVRERVRRAALLGGDPRLAGLHAVLDGVSELRHAKETLRTLDDALRFGDGLATRDLPAQIIAAAIGAGVAVEPRVTAALEAQQAAHALPAAIAPGAEDGDAEDHRLAALARMHALLDAAGHIDAPNDLGQSLQAVAQAVSETLGFRNVVINLYRPEWDDYIVATVFGAAEVRDSLLGCTYDWPMWEQVLDERFERRGTYVVYAGDYDWDDQAGRRYVPDLPVRDHERAWLPEDEVFVTFHQADGTLAGILNVGDPTSGLRPTDAELDTLVVVARHAARAVERAQMASAAVAHRRGLERLLSISTEITRADAVDGVLEAVTDGVADALGFATVTVHLTDPDAPGGRLALAARSDRDGPHPPLALPVGMAALTALFTADVERAGCFLLTRDEAARRVPALAAVPPGRLNGRGPHAWCHHWLLVPLTGHDGEPIGVIVADDPHDRLLPSTEKLQALRLFAHQAANALETIGQREQLRLLAERDPLTRLLNRRALMADLDDAVARGRAEGRPVALAYCDLDGFKRLNDRHGHGAGDALLRAFAEILTASIRPEDRAYRIGGDEFALLLTGCEDDEARQVVDRVLAELTRRQDADIETVSASFGVAVGRDADGLDAAGLLHRADRAMYAEKRSAGVPRSSG